MRRTIVDFVVGDDEHWVARLDCLHRQHVRHQPPFRVAEWVTTPEGRAAHVGHHLDCPLCDRAELPADLVALRTTPTWDESTLPAAIRRDHRVASGRWGLLTVEAGSVGFRAETEPPIEVVVTPEAPQPIPPDVPHHVTPRGPVRCHVTFLGRET